MSGSRDCSICRASPATRKTPRGCGPGQLAGLETVDLGRRLNLRIRQDLTWSDGSRPVSAIDVTRALTERTVPTSPGYNALGRPARSGRVPRRDSRRDPPHAAASAARGLADRPRRAGNAGPDGWVATLDQGRQLVGDGPFRLVSASKGQLRLQRLGRRGSRPAASASVACTRSASPPPPPRSGPWSGARSASSSISRPTASRASPPIPRSRSVNSRGLTCTASRSTAGPRLPNRTLRRGLSYAIDRKSLLEETLYVAPPTRTTRSPTALSQGSYADAADVKPLGYDPLLAKMLIAAARKEPGAPRTN